MDWPSPLSMLRKRLVRYVIKSYGGLKRFTLQPLRLRVTSSAELAPITDTASLSTCTHGDKTTGNHETLY